MRQSTPPPIAKTLALTSFAASMVFVANPAQSSIFTVGGNDYDITTVTGSISQNKTQLESTPWWNNDSLGYDMAVTVGLSLGQYVGYVTGYSFDSSGLPNAAYGYWNTGLFLRHGGPINPLSVNLNGSGSFVWAVGSASSAVPEPLTILGAMTAAGFGVGFKRKLGKSKKDN